MSYQAVRWAQYDAPMLLTEKGKPDSTARQVLVVLAEHANEAGRNAHPSTLRIRYATGLDDRTIERALLRLERGGLIELAGRTYHGTRRWTLHLDLVRPAAEWDEMEAAAEAEREAESARRRARRHRAASINSADVRDSASRTPGVSVRMSGTQSADVRDAESGIRDAVPPEPPEPPKNHPANHPGTTPGGRAAPQTPRRPQAPPTSGPGTAQDRSLSEPLTPAQDQQGESLPRTREQDPPTGELRLVPGPERPAPQPLIPAHTPAVVADAIRKRAAARAAHRTAS